MRQLFIRPALLLAFLSFSALAVGAQSELDRMINGLQSKYNKISTLSADFSQVFTSRDQRERRENGRLLLKKPGRMKWDYTDPEEKHFISDGKWLYEYIVADKSVTRSLIKKTGDMRAPFAFLLGQGNLRQEFRRIEFDPTSVQLGQHSIIQPDRDCSDFIFSHIKDNVWAPSAEFVFKAPPGL